MITLKLYRGPYSNFVTSIEWADDFPLPEVGDYIDISYDDDGYNVNDVFLVNKRKFSLEPRTIYLYEI